MENYVIRLEEEKDYREVEELTREAFWNKYRPGCNEHYILHCYREREEFVKELDYVIEENGKIIAHIMYSHGKINCDDGRDIPVMLFGPVSVLPKYQGKGYGSTLINYTLEQARNIGCGAVVITGSPEYYHRFGFVSGQSMNIYYGRVPRDEKTPYFMVKELIPGYLDGVKGIFMEPEGYMVDESEAEKFDLGFERRSLG